MTIKTGRPSIFGPKDDSQPVRAIGLTKRGRQLFEQFRAKLKKAAKWPGKVSDSDTIEALVRGPQETADYLRKK